MFSGRRSSHEWSAIMAVHVPLTTPSGRTLVKAGAASGLAFTAVFGWSLRRRLRSAASDPLDDALSGAEIGQPTSSVSRAPLREHVGGAVADTVAIPARPLRWIDARVGVRARAAAGIARIRGARVDRRYLRGLDAKASAAVRRVRPAVLDDLQVEPVVRIRRITSDTVRRLRARGTNGSQGVSTAVTSDDEPVEE
jgi:hypothetical protein